MPYALIERNEQKKKTKIVLFAKLIAETQLIKKP